MKKEHKPEIEHERLAYSRREAMRALVKYSATVGGAASVVVTAEGVVSAASAYKCPPKSRAPHCN